MHVASLHPLFPQVHCLGRSITFLLLSPKPCRPSPQLQQWGTNVRNVVQQQ